MRLSELFSPQLMLPLRYIKKQQDPARSGLLYKGMLPNRSGSQRTPLKPRMRKYFNAPLPREPGEIWDVYGSRRPRPTEAD